MGTSLLTCNLLHHSSDPNWEFTIVHNGIITNYKELKTLLSAKGFKFETETDTECIAKLTKYIYDQHPSIGFTDLAKAVIQELEGAYGLLIKSVHYPHEVIAARKGSPLVIGVKTSRRMKVDFVDVEYADENTPLTAEAASQNVALKKNATGGLLTPSSGLLGAPD
jgi:glutamine---fructose-6-phosphate transaminase (isomerizing)